MRERERREGESRRTRRGGGRRGGGKKRENEEEEKEEGRSKVDLIQIYILPPVDLDSNL